MRPREARKFLFEGGDGEQYQRRKKRKPEYIANIWQTVFAAHLIHREERAIDHAEQSENRDKEKFVLVSHLHDA